MRVDRAGPAAVAATAASGASALALWFGTGLHAVAGLTWLATLPMLLIAPALRARWAWLLALVAGAVGFANLASYALHRIEVPLPVVIELIAIEAFAWAAVIATFRGLVTRRHPGWAAVAAPAVAVGLDYVVSMCSPHGTFASLAYTQADTRLLPMAAITGGWGLVACLHAVPAAVAATYWQSRQTQGRLPRAGLVALATSLLATALLPVAGRLAVGDGGRTIRVAAVSVPVPGDDPARLGTHAGDTVLSGDVVALREAAGRGADIAVLAEAGLMVDRSEIADVGRGLRTAAGPSTSVVVGLIVVEPGGTKRNEAVLFVPGRAPVEYRKQHLVPGPEGGVTPGTRTVVATVDGMRWGLLICKDLDFPRTVRSTAREGARLALVPAWDFRADGWLHSRMAMVSGAENGFPMVRSARGGRATVSDVRGQVVAEGDTEETSTQVVVATVRVGDRETPYTRLGDWLPWLALATAGASLFVLLRTRRGPS